MSSLRMKRIFSFISTVVLAVGFTACGNPDFQDGEVSPSAVPSPPPSLAPEITAPPEGINVLYQLNDYSQMMSYVIRTKNNKLIIIDGGYDRNGKDLVQLAKTLTEQEVPEIEAWLMTHVHEDHVDAFSEIMSKKTPALNVKQIYYNFPSRNFVEKYAESTLETYDKFTKAAAKFTDNQITIVQTGDTYTIDGINIEVMLTPDESITENPINESSVVYRLTIDGQTVLFLGDAAQAAGTRLLKTYKDDLSSDVVQMAHHGSHGVAKSVYKQINPKVCLWPTPKWLWENDSGEGYNSGPHETILVYEYVRDKVGVQKHYIAKDGIQILEFPLTLA